MLFSYVSVGSNPEKKLGVIIIKILNKKALKILPPPPLGSSSPRPQRTQMPRPASSPSSRPTLSYSSPSAAACANAAPGPAGSYAREALCRRFFLPGGGARGFSGQPCRWILTERQ